MGHLLINMEDKMKSYEQFEKYEYKKGEEIIKDISGPAAGLILQHIKDLPEPYSSLMIECYGELVEQSLSHKISARDIAIAGFGIRLGGHLDLVPGIVYLINEGFTKEDIASILGAASILVGFGRAKAIWDDVDEAFKIWESLPKK